MLAAAAHSVLNLIPEQAVLPILSGPLRGTRWIVGSGRKAYWLGTYERHFQRLLWSQLHADSVFYDIGANAGFYSLLAARRGARVISIEPLPANASFVRRHAELNGYSRIAVYELALSDRNGSACFAGDGATGHLDSSGVEVNTATLDSLSLPTPTHIKMDIEGAELEALQGAEHCIRQHRPKIFLAVHSPELHRDCIQLLSGWGFAITVLAQLEDGRADLVATT